MTAVAHPKKLRVLVVDDNEDATELMAVSLDALGHLPHVAHDADGAIESLIEHETDVAFFDIGLPGTDGFELAKKVRADRRWKHVWLVALTGYSGDEDVARARAAGFDEHVVKPLGLEQLGTLLDRLSAASRS